MINMKKKAFTLVEVQLAAIIAAFILIAAISSYIFYWKSFSAGNIFLDVYSNSRIAMGWMAKDIRWAAQIAPNSTLGAITRTTSDNCIVLSVPSIKSSGDIISSQFDEIIYLITNDDLHRIVYPFKTGTNPSIRSTEDRIIATDCSQLAFSSSTPSSGGIQPLSYFVGLSELPDINTVYISLPLNEKTIFSTNTGGASLRPTTVVKLRNKQ